MWGRVVVVLQVTGGAVAADEEAALQGDNKRVELSKGGTQKSLPSRPLCRAEMYQATRRLTRSASLAVLTGVGSAVRSLGQRKLSRPWTSAGRAC